MSIAEKSPTVIYSESSDENWFKKSGGGIGYGNDDESPYDNEGYDSNGYDKHGMDRAGYHEEQYNEITYKEVLEDFDGIFIPHLLQGRNSSEFRFLEEQEDALLLEKAETEEYLKNLNKRLESVKKKKEEFGVSAVMHENVLFPKRGFGR